MPVIQGCDQRTTRCKLSDLSLLRSLGFPIGLRRHMWLTWRPVVVAWLQLANSYNELLKYVFFLSLHELFADAPTF